MSFDTLGELLADDVWQMNLGERVALEGLLRLLRPRLAVEIGTAEGASLKRIAAHAGEVHSFDLRRPEFTDLGSHVVLHTGDSHELLPQVLEEFGQTGRNVDFVLVDGDHSADGVRADVEAVLQAPAAGRTVVVVHDTGNEEVRRGLDAVPFGAYPKVQHVDLDLVPGHLGRARFSGELWYGLGIVVVDATVPAYGTGSPLQEDRWHGGELLAFARDVLGGRLRSAADVVDLEGRVAELEAQLAEQRQRADRAEGLVQALLGSPTMRLTAPLRAALASIRHRP